ncbi:MAG: 3'(2'),5'-bisphosphate nucleotidase, partial [Calditrichaeota bacterium]|nr:3'(2'),5'-bisphosphate nucleotidase [Calditrichota bacterium]
MPYEKELSIAISAIESAVNLCRGVQQNLIAADTVEKNDRSPVTIADLGTQAVVFRAVHRAFPGDALIGEEDSSQLRENAELLEKVLGLT